MVYGLAPTVPLRARTKRSLPFRQLHSAFPVDSLARSLGTFGPVFPQARGLRHESSSSCGQLSCPQTTMPHPTPHEVLGVSYSSRLPTSTLLPMLHEVSRVHIVRLKRDDVGGAFSFAPSALCGFREYPQGRSG